METKLVEALVSVGDRYAGVAPVFEADRPWWSEIEAVTDHLQGLLGVPVTVLRLLHAEDTAAGRGGRVAYHVEAAGEPRDGVLDPTPRPDWADLTAPHPLRSSWAEPNGPRALTDWAIDSLGARLTGPPKQVKTWNLSCLVRLPTADGGAWAKATSRFCSVDAAIIQHVRRYDAELAPPVLALDRDRRWSLLRHVPGIDCWEPDEASVQDVVSRWVAVQASLAGDTDELGAPELVPAQLPEQLEALLAGELGATLTPQELADGNELLTRLPLLTEALESSGLPLTLVHGDFHPGNWRSDGTTRMVVDWADSYVSHPAVDIRRLAGYLSGPKLDLALTTWSSAWQQAVPGCRPQRALAPMTALARLLGALMYQRFLDNIEPSERVYHEDDPRTELRAAVELSRRVVR